MSDESVTLAALRKVVADFVAQREWECYHDAKNLAMSIAIETAELMEHFQWVKSDELPALLADEARRAAITDEIADITCYLLALANVLEIDVSTALTDKMAKNAAKYPVEQFRGRYFKPGEHDARGG
ncbi:MAG: nucleotide pyrophosphohydrolase [Phycisphaerae bacterium]|nr:nucleotide pyrophosphohydrolase [Phycisphaerae bacterium]